MKQIFLVSSLFELVCLAAGIDSGEYDNVAAPSLLGTGGITPNTSGTRPERILLVTNNAAVLELSTNAVNAPGADVLVQRFDRVIDLNEFVAPSHPVSWKPAYADLLMVERYLRTAWDLGEDDIELIVDSPQVNPAMALGRIFSKATIRVHSDGLMPYGPTRNNIPLTNGQRISTLHYLPLVEGLTPRMLSEFGIVPKPVDLEAFRQVVRELGESGIDDLDPALWDQLKDEPWALAVGQYLAALNLLTVDEETDLHIAMLKSAAKRGFRTVVFKPHPSAPPTQLNPLLAAADDLGITLRILDVPLLAEVVIDRYRPSLIIGGFSTALASAREVYGVPALAVGADMLLERITPYQNSNRIPLTIISEIADGTLPTDILPASGGDPESTSVLRQAPPGELAALVEAVTYCMAPQRSHDLRGRTIAFLDRVFPSKDTGGREHTAPGVDNRSDPQRYRRYFKRRRLSSLDLPGSNTRKIAPKRLLKQSSILALSAANRQRRRIMTRLRR